MRVDERIGRNDQEDGINTITGIDIPVFFGAPGRAHLLGGETPILALQGAELAEWQGCRGMLHLISEPFVESPDQSSRLFGRATAQVAAGGGRESLDLFHCAAACAALRCFCIELLRFACRTALIVEAADLDGP